MTGHSLIPADLDVPAIWRRNVMAAEAITQFLRTQGNETARRWAERTEAEARLAATAKALAGIGIAP